ncbi:Ig-like domain-containing protein [Variovorax sp. PCZ-1]|uniref:Ig-like domain-containing protein n=1 Tax=Variovorax sp. PCZ-1 TaxID=2835533 RepID=UPI001BCACBA8|nr:Ig-like domain-containing protein [Variovorax sp. PCZ-1]MBS7808419.1 Ig-like domain-containing protein [Variovorax sp. PCZ-1]
MKFLKWIAAGILAASLIACGGGGGSAGTNSINPTPTPNPNTDTTTNTATASVTALAISSSVNQINADNSDNATIVVTAINASNASVSGAEIRLSTDTGLLDASAKLTDATGRASFVLSSGTLNQTNRIASLTAISGTRSAQTSIRIAGGSLTIDTSGVNVIVSGSTPLTFNVSLRNATGAVVPNSTLTLSSSNPNAVSTTAVTAVTNAVGIATFSLTGLSVGSSNVSVSGGGLVAAKEISVTAPGTGFFFLSPSNNSVISTGSANAISVQAGTATQVQFVTTLGTFVGGSNVLTAPVNSGVASAVLTVPAAGVATINAIHASVSSISATLALNASPPVSSANKLLLTASRNSVSVSSGTSLNTVQIKARALFNSAGIDAAVFGVPVLFSISGGPGAGERLSQAIVYTNAAGEAITDFVAGTQASTQNGISVTAQILGTAVRTGTSPSGNDVVLTVGGQALSVAFSPSTVIRSSADNTFYELDFSAQVTDAGGGSVVGVPVSLNVKPYAFTVGSVNACSANQTTTFTYCSEDRNGNGSLDNGEDGQRIQLPFGLNPVACTNPVVFGTSNSQLTPPNSAAGSVPPIVTTGSNGIAPFTLTYLKGSAVWIVVELSATVSSSGTEAKSSSIFRLSPSATDAASNPCALPASPYAN